MDQLQRETIAITKELGNVVFIGAVAVLAHLGWKYRRTHDFDIAMAVKLEKEELEKRGYKTFREGGKEVVRSPRGYKVDIYTEDVNEIPVRTVMTTAAEIPLKNEKIRVVAIEVLFVAKLRTARPQDMEDLRELCKKHGNSINWAFLRELASGTEISTIEQMVRALG